MRITVQRSGGLAGMTHVWTVDAVTRDDKLRWMPIVEACPWDAAPVRGKGAPAQGNAPQPDRFTPSTRAAQRRATLPEQAVTGPWRVLVESAKAEGEPGRG